MDQTKTYLITYRDPESQEMMSVEKIFTDSEEFPARMWAEDYGYALADKGYYEVVEVRRR